MMTTRSKETNEAHMYTSVASLIPIKIQHKFTRTNRQSITTGDSYRGVLLNPLVVDSTAV